ncbi:MAG: hypothetical protein AVDCRST_MAG17-2343 [uncultured Solirubrobacterales bacterium]|uniref:Uncharacterized protein n=1 Tax=uncultured Solirubrobacterales bacterium TaxID=768556 RepID=A0A6J4T9G9_9ACTN|nr:MAG: hypothetical protein AVDCRST_MAG17-2343 [uncultured Solirubrobacterales bacterium]
MPRTLFPTLLVTFGLMLATAAPVLAVGTDDGEGFLGEANDRIITAFSMGVIAFFPLVALLLSLMQSALDKRKARRKTASERRRSGW